MNRTTHLLESLTLLALLPLACLRTFLRGLLRRKTCRVIGITGWYGSETIGDVAILGQVIHEWQQVIQNPQIYVTSFNRHITQRSLDDIQCPAMTIVNVGIASGLQLLSTDILIFGGGPLMESRMMPIWLLRAVFARVCGARVVLHGCGVGPIRSRFTQRVVRTLLMCSHCVLLRDTDSVHWATCHCPSANCHASTDPALAYVKHRSLTLPTHDTIRSQPPTIGLFFRSIPAVYSRGHHPVDSDHLLNQLAKAIMEIASEKDARFAGFIMHEDFAESDDREIYRQLNARLREEIQIEVPPSRQRLPEIIGQLASVDACLAMRFHGSVFSVAAGKPLLAFDYCQPPGKTTSFLKDVDRKHAVMPIEDLSSNRITRQFFAQSNAINPTTVDTGQDARLTILRTLLSDTKDRR